MTEHICPLCGARSGEKRFIEAFCIDCYPANIKLPGKMVIERCKHCERMRISGKWIPYDEKKIGAYVVGKCKGDFSEAYYDLETQKAAFTVDKSGAQIEKRITVEIATTVCPECSRISGGYFEAIVQIRGDPYKVEKYAAKLMDRLKEITFITKTEEKHGGVDIYAGKSKPVVAMFNELGTKVLITSKLVGVSQGKRLYRTTFLVRLE